MRELGGGSTATVYLADDTRLGRQVAIKVLRREYASTFAAERFLREIAIAARLQHPHIVPLLESGEIAGSLYLVMPFVEGESLRARLGRQGPLPPGEVIRILADVADALAYAHGKGIVHRDIKPDNILFAGRHALVTDFGVAKAVSAAALDQRDLTVGVALGTPSYMAPEQATADPQLDHRVDLYALGIVGYEMLTGAPPFDGATSQAILTAQVLDAPAPLAERRPEVPPALASIIMRALEKAPDQRWPSADELLRQLEPLATPSGGSTPATIVPVYQRPRWGRWLAAALGGVAFLALVVRLTFGVARATAPMPVMTSQRQLTFSGEVSAAAISPDGQLLAYITDSGGRERLLVQDVRGGAAIPAAEAGTLEYPTWSGDGSEIRFYAFDSVVPRLQAVPRLGGPRRALGAAAYAALSPDGSRLAQLPGGGSHLTVTTIATGDSVRVELPADRWLSQVVWSPNGKRLAYATLRVSGRLTELRLASAPAFVPEVVVQDSVPLGVPGWGAGDGTLFYLRGVGDLADLMALPLDARGNAAGAPHIVVPGVVAGTVDPRRPFLPPVSLTADGRQLVYIQNQQWSNLVEAPLASAGRGPLRTMLTDGSARYHAARYSPDGRSLAFIRSQTDGLTLRVMSARGGPAAELGRVDGAISMAWSRDGRRIAVTAAYADSGIGLRIFSVDGGAMRAAFAGQVGATLDWANDSEIVVPGLGNRALQLVNPATGARQPLPGVDSAGWRFYPRISPDGTRLAYSWNRGGGRTGVSVLQLAKGTTVPLFNGLADPVGWSADGRTLYLATLSLMGDSIRLSAVPMAGGAPTLLLTLPPHFEVLDVTPDGRTALINMTQGRSDAWSVQLAPDASH